MALLWMDSFDHYTSADLLEKYLVADTSPSINAAGRRATNALRVQFSSSQVVTPTFLPSSATAIIGIAMKASALNLGNVLYVRLGTTVQVALGFNSSGLAYVNRGTSTNLRGATFGVIPVNAYVYVEFKVVIHPTAGSFIVRLNELEVLNVTGVNTSTSGTAAWDNVAIVSSNAVQIDWDDYYILDGSGPAPLNNLLGDCRVDARYPQPGSGHNAWTPSTPGDNALMVDETAPDDDTTYNSTPTIGATDTHVVQDAIAGATLYGAQVSISRKKSDAGSCAIAPVVRTAGADYVGASVNPGTSYSYTVTPYGFNPGTGFAWTEAEFNAAEFGYKRTA